MLGKKERRLRNTKQKKGVEGRRDEERLKIHEERRKRFAN